MAREAPLTIKYVFAGIAVADYDSALAWYTRFFGRSPDVIVTENESMWAILTYVFTELGLHRVEAIIDIMNDRSKGLLLKLGFTYEGKLRQRYSFRGRFEDEYYFGLLRDEWQGSV